VLRLTQIHNRKREITDADLDRLVAAYPDRVLAAVERYTRPRFQFAAE
jgi:hypothetical protein